MNFGECPYDDCSGLLMLEVPRQTPAYVKLDCDDCGRAVWYRLSRVDPDCWTEVEFLRRYSVDGKTIKVKPVGDFRGYYGRIL